MKTFLPLRLYPLLLGAGVLVSVARGETDKSGYTLWNPTPREQMRELSTDRPDITESPYSVDAGHVQVEADLLSYSYDRYNPSRTDETVEGWSAATANLKVGLNNLADFQ